MQIMKHITIPFIVSLLLATISHASIIVQEWNFTEDGSGLSDRVSEQGLNAQFFDNPDPVAFDGGLTIQRGNGFAGDRPLGIALNDSNATEITLSVTLASWDFSAGTIDTKFGIQFRNDTANSTITDLGFHKQDSNSRIRLTGTAVAGIAVDAESGGSITYGLTLDLVNDTYTYWIGTPTSDGSTWANRFAGHTGTITDLGVADIDAVRWSISNHTAGNQFVLDQVQIAYTAVPEPATIALLMGFAALGLVIYRRRQ